MGTVLYARSYVMWFFHYIMALLSVVYLWTCSGAAEVCGRPLVLKKRSSKEALGEIMFLNQRAMRCVVVSLSHLSMLHVVVV